MFFCSSSDAISASSCHVTWSTASFVRLLKQAGLASKVFGGWQINGNTTFQSGFPVQINGGNGSGSFAGTQRPNWNGTNATLSGPVTGRLLHRIKVGEGPHGLCVWPQPGRYSIGHTGILR